MAIRLRLAMAGSRGWPYDAYRVFAKDHSPKGLSWSVTMLFGLLETAAEKQIRLDREASSVIAKAAEEAEFAKFRFRFKIALAIGFIALVAGLVAQEFMELNADILSRREQDDKIHRLKLSMPDRQFFDAKANPTNTERGVHGDTAYMGIRLKLQSMIVLLDFTLADVRWS